MGVVDPAAVAKEVEVLTKRVEYLEDQLAKIYTLLKWIDHDLVFWRDDEKENQG